jgi:hypothetical protein
VLHSACWLCGNHAFAGQQVTFVSVISRDPPKLGDACFTISTCWSIDYKGKYRNPTNYFLLGRVGEEGWGEKVGGKEIRFVEKGDKVSGRLGKVVTWPPQSRNLGRWGLGACCSGVELLC